MRQTTNSKNYKPIVSCTDTYGSGYNLYLCYFNYGRTIASYLRDKTYKMLAMHINSVTELL